MSRVLKTISVDLSKRGAIKNAVKQVAKFEKELKEGLYGLCEAMLDDGVLIAKAEVISLDAVDTGELAESIERGVFDKNSGFGIIRATAYYAIFVEYGTGYVGANAEAHPWAADAGTDRHAAGKPGTAAAGR